MLKKYTTGIFRKNSKVHIEPSTEFLANNDSDDGGYDDQEDEYSTEFFHDDNHIHLHQTRWYGRIWERIRELITYHRIKGYVRWLLDYAAIQINMHITFDDVALLFTLYVLFAPSIAYLVLPKSSDGVITVITVIAFSFFIFEVCASTWSKTAFTLSWKTIEMDNQLYIGRLYYPNAVYWNGYFLTFLWFLDIIVIVSMFPDVPAIAASFHFNDAKKALDIFRAVRLVRLFKIVKAYKNIIEHRRHVAEKMEILNLGLKGYVDVNEELERLEKAKKRPSKLGDKLTESTTVRVIVVILTLLIIIPLLIYRPPNHVFSYATTLLQSININNSLSSQVKNICINTIVSEINHISTPILYLDIYPYQNGTLIVDNVEKLNLLRQDAVMSEYDSYFNMSDSIYYFTSAEYSIDESLREHAVYTIVLTFVTGILLFVANFVFTYDIKNLVLKPIGRMMTMVETVARNPLAKFSFDHDDGYGSYETNLLEKTFVKIAGLLRVGFGEAGAGIIKSNLALNDENHLSSIINPLLPGIRVYCIVGFCDIHQFDFVLKKLEKDVLTFVNTIAAIVHEQVHSWEGSCNKNLGNAFVIIWRIGEESSLAKYSFWGPVKAKENESIKINESTRYISKSIKRIANSSSRSLRQASGNMGSNRIVGNSSGGSSKSSKKYGGLLSKYSNASRKGKSNGSDRSVNSNSTTGTKLDAHSNAEKQKYQKVDLRRLPGVDKLAAKALIGFLKVISELNRSGSIAKYNADKRLENDGTPFQVRMGFGLHAGWAIEGAVGSLQKVDATYLSPHVNMAARLETASRQYGVPLLVSQDFYDLLSPYIQKYMRRLDVVTVKGSETAIGIYTYDTLMQPPKPIMVERLRRSRTRGGSNGINGGGGGGGGKTMAASNKGISGFIGSSNKAGTSIRLKSRGTWFDGSAIQPSVNDMKSPFVVLDQRTNGVNANNSWLDVPTSDPDFYSPNNSPEKSRHIDSFINNNNNNNNGMTTDTITAPSPVRVGVSRTTSFASDVGSEIGSEGAGEGGNKGRISIALLNPQDVAAVHAFSHSNKNNTNHRTSTSFLIDLSQREEQKRTNSSGNVLIQQQKQQQQRKVEKGPIFTSSNEPEEVFDKDSDMIHLRSHIAIEFTTIFTEGVSKYISGDWITAKELLENADALMKENVDILDNKGDGPSQTLLRYMASFHYTPPLKWLGFRPLTSK